MTKQSAETLQFLKEMATQETNAQMQALAEAIKRLESAKAQQATLEQYQAEYQAQLNATALKGMNAMMYQNFRQFSQQLEQAIQGQVGKLTHMVKVVEDKRSAWQMAQRKEKSYDVLIQRSKQQAKKIELKREQKLMDEFAGRAKRVS